MPLTYEELLQRLHALLGAEVVITVSSEHGRSRPAVAINGVLQSGVDSPAIEIMKALGRAPEDDEGIMFQIGAGIESEARITVSRSGFVEAGEEGAMLWFCDEGLIVTVMRRDLAEAEAKRIRQDYGP